MHPEYCKTLVASQLADATKAGVFGDRMELEEFTFPKLYVRVRNRSGKIILLRFDVAGYDLQAPLIEPVDPISRSVLLRGEWPRRQGGEFPAHPDEEGGPFLCIEGNRSYFTHPSHLPSVTGKRWDNYRIELRLPQLLVAINERFADGRWE